MRKPVMTANWKMHKTHLDAIRFVEQLRNRLRDSDYDAAEVVLCPPFTALRSVQTMIEADDLQIRLGAQNMHWEEAGAYTGEVSPLMLAKLAVRYVIVGHSERRELFGENDEEVNKKVRAASSAGVVPIMCVGETLEEREEDRTQEKVSVQVKEGLKGLKPEQVAEMIVAYEPIWAIGTGKTSSSEDAQEVIAMIRQTVGDADLEASKALRILYGGSVKPGNIAALMAQPDIDGALVGGASLDPEDFAMIVRYQSD